MMIVFHITHSQQWEAAKQVGFYRGDTLDTEGFIHCSTLPQVTRSANKFFAGKTGLLLLSIDSDKVQAEIKYEEAAGELFPHIYGPLNVGAVVQVVEFVAGEDGKFELPDGLKEIT
ncbi:MAG: DUF952 domain-containing protein [Oscillatoriales cyanobacterium RU_3_3]|nr:DUF952 domain-containing protein [Microcoleus sp. SU_5_6]NJL68935.1 DUF952 domain-containing protein [Microcoleus sp. SM1_3_4]NJM60843.1 DUF952 domain-containing protein [Oscillatoriales cyanobacterium RU_3_3]NJR26121.1 DUF952 domain-containing protein [Richelia sp. CSU_2_1]